MIDPELTIDIDGKPVKLAEMVEMWRDHERADRWWAERFIKVAHLLWARKLTEEEYTAAREMGLYVAALDPRKSVVESPSALPKPEGEK